MRGWCRYLLWQQLGLAVLAGLAVMLLMIPITGAVTKYMKAKQGLLMKRKDLRIRAVNEIVANISILKMYGVESRE